MECDVVVALGRATVDGHTLFGQNSNRPAGASQPLYRSVGREFAAGEKTRTQFRDLPQARRTHSVLGSRPEGWWGYSHGINDQGLAIGCGALNYKLRCSEPGLTGGDLVRLGLERCCTGRQAVDLLTGLVERYGQGPSPGPFASLASDNAFLIADPREAFAVEAAGKHWVYQEIREVRALSNVSVIRQDWDRISHGLAEVTITHGWWPADGSKLDFAGTLSEDPVGQASGLRRWGRATLLLEEQNGHIDASFLRRILSDHYEGTHFEVNPLATNGGPVPVCHHVSGPRGSTTAASWVAQLGSTPQRLPVAWCSFGPPCHNIYFPLFLDGEPPLSFTVGGRDSSATSLWWQVQRLHDYLRGDLERWALARQNFGRLQARFDTEADDFALDGAALKQRGELAELQRLAGVFMQNCLEQFEAVLASIGYRYSGAGQHAQPAGTGQVHTPQLVADHR
jgi:secernin